MIKCKRLIGVEWEFNQNIEIPNWSGKITTNG